MSKSVESQKLTHLTRRMRHVILVALQKLLGFGDVRGQKRPLHMKTNGIYSSLKAETQNK